MDSHIPYLSNTLEIPVHRRGDSKITSLCLWTSNGNISKSIQTCESIQTCGRISLAQGISQVSRYKSGGSSGSACSHYGLNTEILKNRDPAIIQIEAIRRIVSISTANQSRLRDIQKTNVTDIADAIAKKHHVVQKLLSGVFLMKFANALMLLAGQASLDNPRQSCEGTPRGAQPGVQAQIAREIH
jgi:hypothetical protein